MSFTNRNISKNFAASVQTSSWVELAANGDTKGTGGTGQECSEVLISHTINGGVKILDRWTGTNPENYNWIYIPEDTPTTIKGITNTNELSAQGISNTGVLYYRSSFFSGFVQTG